ncbi:MBL fold metallo-hydrolase [Thermotoga sp. SG1]|uniref:MBL fold metallo-hydrolase n=1 Tax=Thermotoga sp. SG1 TaxID=126739 RepID=UPI000C77870D|nr:MBL fold metallo-hydrolase [Thermotoga sp. SG1]PLV56324.1 MBL fold metallo-hydrolase [Thermotoga sp. SG1]
MRKDEYRSTLIEPGVWHITDYRGGSMYLVVGNEKALLIDTGMGEGDLKSFIGSITEKPVEVVLTHAHWDHIMQAGQFERVYLNHRDFQIIELFKIKVDHRNFLDVREKERFNLGGRELEVIEVPGHTPGSIVFLDRENKLLFSGDAVGAGHTWMHLPGCLPLREYLESLKKLKEIDSFEKIYHGHLSGTQLKPFEPDYLEDLIKAVEGVNDGSLKGETYPYGNFKGLYVTYGKAVLVYNPENI